LPLQCPSARPHRESDQWIIGYPQAVEGEAVKAVHHPKHLRHQKNEEKIVIIILIILIIIIIMKQPPAVTASGWMISPESFAKRLWMVLEDPHKVLGFRQNVAGDALAPGSQLSAPKKNSAATVVGLPKNGGRPKNGHQTMGKTMINQESLIFAVPKSATKPSWAT